jgi:hypothetical protein
MSGENKDEILDTILTWGPKSNVKRPKDAFTDLNLVLDIDECMVHTSTDMRKFRDLGIFRDPNLLSLRKRTYRLVIDDLDTPGNANSNDIWGITRPHLYTALSYSFKYFKHIYVWSSGHKRYVNTMVNFIFRDLPKPDGILTNDDCGIYNGDKFYKPLSHLYQKYSHHDLSPKTTIMLDDVPENMRANKGNGIVVPKYQPSPRLDHLKKNDTMFLQFLDWIKSDEVLDSEDIRKCVKPKFTN